MAVPDDNAGSGSGGASTGQPSAEQLRPARLASLAVLGFALVVASVVANVGAASVLLEVGAGLLLFALLFWAERRFVVREVRAQTQRLLEALTWTPEQVREMAADPDMAEMADRFAEDGPIGVAERFLVAMCAGDYERGWAAADSDWRLSRVQSWLWNNRHHFGAEAKILEELASSLAAKGEPVDIWHDFVLSEKRQFAESWSGFEPDKMGAASRRRRIGPNYEVVLFVPLGEFEQGFVARGSVEVSNVARLTVHRTSDGWLVASHLGVAPPKPGWPPAWWAEGDPALDDADV